MSSDFFLLLYFSISVQFGMNMLNNLKQQLSDNCPKYLVAPFIQTEGVSLTLRTFTLLME